MTDVQCLNPDEFETTFRGARILGMIMTTLRSRDIAVLTASFPTLTSLHLVRAHQAYSYFSQARLRLTLRCSSGDGGHVIAAHCISLQRFMNRTCTVTGVTS